MNAADRVIHSDYIAARDLLYTPLKFLFSDLMVEKEGLEYGACSFKLNSLFVRFRVAKTTPIKIGQFVTLWKRIKNGLIKPYDIEEDVDFFVISTRRDNKFGQFIFPKSVLFGHGIISSNNQGGKLAIRVYPPWDAPISTQAQKTQAWQLPYFIELSNKNAIDFARAQMLLYCESKFKFGSLNQ